MIGLKPFSGYVLINRMRESSNEFRCLTIWTSRTRKGEEEVVVLTLTKRGRLTQASRDFMNDRFPGETNEAP